MQTESRNNSPSTFWNILVNKLTAVHPSVITLSDIRRAQLVMVFAMTIELVCIASLVGVFIVRRKFDTVSVVLALVGILCFAVYGLGRTQHYKLGAWLVITTMAAAGYLLLVWSTSATRIIDLFIMLPMALTMAAGLLSVREQVVFLLLNVAIVAALPFLNILNTSTGQYAGIFLSLGILLLIVSAFRSNVEHGQFVELNRANQELHAVKDNLEELVRIGTESAEKARSETATALYALQEQAWFLNAQVSLADALRGEQDLHTLTNRAMQALCSELKSPVGAFFLFAENKLNFTGGFAYLPNEQNPASFELGEGLVGQAAVDRRKIFIKNIPAGYFEIISGLGNALPNQVALLPCIYNKQLIGVIELGLLTGLSQSNLQFIDAAVESISIAMQTACDRQRISELLAETQTQAEELQSREEELRAINEELEAQAENLREASNRAS